MSASILTLTTRARQHHFNRGNSRPRLFDQHRARRVDVTPGGCSRGVLDHSGERHLTRARVGTIAAVNRRIPVPMIVRIDSAMIGSTIMEAHAFCDSQRRFERLNFLSRAINKASKTVRYTRRERWRKGISNL